MKKLISISLALLFASVFSAFAFAYDNTVDDGAGLFTESECSEILSQASEYSAATDISLAVLTIDNAQGLSSEEYAEDYIDNLIDTEGWSEDSMLFLIDMDNRNVWVCVTGRAEYIYYNADLIIDGGYYELVNGYYGRCILGMIDAASDNYTVYDSYDDSYDDGYYGGYYDDGGYDYEEDYYYGGYDGYHGGTKSFNFGNILIYIIVGLGIGGISVFAVKSRYKNFGKGDEFDTDDVVLNLTGSDDNIISRNVVTTRIPRNNNHHHGGGGSHGGGGHSGGGGRSHGGGGRGF